MFQALRLRHTRRSVPLGLIPVISHKFRSAKMLYWSGQLVNGGSLILAFGNFFISSSMKTHRGDRLDIKIKAFSYSFIAVLLGSSHGFAGTGTPFDAIGLQSQYKRSFASTRGVHYG
jgi:hypothetical protein